MAEPNYRRLSAEDRGQIIGLHQGGYAVKDIAELIGTWIIRTKC